MHCVAYNQRRITAALCCSHGQASTVVSSCVQMQDDALKQHAERLAHAVDMARTLQRSEETLLKDRMETVCISL